jgi:predicted tellurium resistance membrane protein TerC
MAALATLIAMEVVLGLDNLVLIALVSNRSGGEARRAASCCRSRWCSP